MANGFQSQGQSNTPIPSPFQTNPFRAKVSPGNLPPNPDHIAVNEQLSALTYPLDRPKYFMHFGIYDYIRTGLLEVGTTQPWQGGSNQIVMPLSESLVDRLTARWEEHPLPWLIAGGYEAIKGFAQTQQEIAETRRRGEITEQEAIRRGQQNLQQNLRRFFTRETATNLTMEYGTRAPIVGETISTLTGIAPNQFMTILYIGPEYKQYTFQWNLSPRSPNESEVLRGIINTFKKAMSPTIKYGVLWGYPCVFRIMFRPNNEQLYKFRPCVLKHFLVNWTPLGRAAFYAGASGGASLGAPEGCTITATFFELEYWTQEKMSDYPIRSTNIATSSDF